jgi:hypothetical protein
MARWHARGGGEVLQAERHSPLLLAHD